MNTEPILLALLLVITNGLTAFISNIFAKKKASAETSNYISLAYTKLVDDLQNQIEILKAQIEILKKENIEMQSKIKQMNATINKKV